MIQGITHAPIRTPAGVNCKVTAGDTAVFYQDNGIGHIVDDLTEGRDTWLGYGGDEDEWTEAVAYVDSLR